MCCCFYGPHSITLPLTSILDSLHILYQCTETTVKTVYLALQHLMPVMQVDKHHTWAAYAGCGTY